MKKYKNSGLLICLVSIVAYGYPSYVKAMYPIPFEDIEEISTEVTEIADTVQQKADEVMHIRNQIESTAKLGKTGMLQGLSQYAEYVDDSKDFKAKKNTEEREKAESLANTKKAEAEAKSLKEEAKAEAEKETKTEIQEQEAENLRNVVKSEVGEVVYLGDGMCGVKTCTDEGCSTSQPSACSDGNYHDPNNAEMAIVCEAGDCMSAPASDVFKD